MIYRGAWQIEELDIYRKLNNQYIYRSPRWVPVIYIYIYIYIYLYIYIYIYIYIYASLIVTIRHYLRLFAVFGDYSGFTTSQVSGIKTENPNAPSLRGGPLNRRRMRNQRERLFISCTEPGVIDAKLKGEGRGAYQSVRRYSRNTDWYYGWKTEIVKL